MAFTLMSVVEHYTYAQCLFIWQIVTCPHNSESLKSRKLKGETFHNGLHTSCTW